MTSSLPQVCRMMSNAIESRFLCILRCQRVSASKETWMKRSVDVAELLHNAVALFKQTAISAGAHVIALCVKNVVYNERDNDEGAAANGISCPTLEEVEDVELRAKLGELLKPVLLWLEPPGENVIAELIVAQTGFGMQRNDAVGAFRSNGQCVDNWLILEGYGRGTDEEAIVPPAAFGRQQGGKKS